MTPQPQTDTREIDALRTRYHWLRQQDITDANTALEWVIVHTRLDELGYVLNADESDWIPAAAQEGDIHDHK